MVDNLAVGLVEAAREVLLREGKADGVADAHAEGTSSHLDAVGDEVLGVTGGHGIPLAEVLEVVVLRDREEKGTRRWGVKVSLGRVLRGCGNNAESRLAGGPCSLIGDRFFAEIGAPGRWSPRATRRVDGIRGAGSIVASVAVNRGRRSPLENRASRGDSDRINPRRH